jgi:hypothetical protein
MLNERIISENVFESISKEAQFKALFGNYSLSICPRQSITRSQFFRKVAYLGEETFKGKSLPRSYSCLTTRHEGTWGDRQYSSYSFFTSALEGVSGQHHVPAALYLRGKDPRYPLYRRLGGPQSWSGHRNYRKNPLPLPGIEPRSLDCSVVS